MRRMCDESGWKICIQLVRGGEKDGINGIMR
jgi:hypothetical protein